MSEQWGPAVAPRKSSNLPDCWQTIQGRDPKNLVCFVTGTAWSMKSRGKKRTGDDSGVWQVKQTWHQSDILQLVIIFSVSFGCKGNLNMAWMSAPSLSLCYWWGTKSCRGEPKQPNDNGLFKFKIMFLISIISSILRVT